MGKFEEELNKLEEITKRIRENENYSVEDALLALQEGLTIVAGLEKKIDQMENTVQELTNNPSKEEGIEPKIEPFSESEEDLQGSPIKGTRK